MSRLALFETWQPTNSTTVSKELLCNEYMNYSQANTHRQSGAKKCQLHIHHYWSHFTKVLSPTKVYAILMHGSEAGDKIRAWVTPDTIEKGKTC